MTDNENVLPNKTALSRVRANKVWKVNVYVRDATLIRRIKQMALDDDLTYNNLFLASVMMYMNTRAQETKPEKSELIP